MKRTNLFQLLLFSTFILLCGTACDNGEDERLSPMKKVIMEGNNNSVEIIMSRTNWKIVSLTSLDGWNQLASGLEGFGTIYFDWGSITRDKEDALTIQANENLEDEERGLIINLSTSSGLYTEQIIVQQSPGDKYEIKSITYSLEEEDGEFWMDSRPYGLTFRNYTDNSTTTTIFPYDHAPEEYQFHCPNDLAFKLLKYEEPLVDVPEIVDEKIQLTGEKVKYSLFPQQYDSKLKYTEVKVETPPQKQTKISGLILYKLHQITYTLTLTNERTQEEKIVKGEMSRKFPYFHTKPRTEVSELPSQE